MSNPTFDHTTFLIRRKILTLLDAKFHLYADGDQLIGYTKQKAFKLKQDIRLYTDESMSQELLHIGARQMIDFAAAYDVTDVVAGEPVGIIRRKGWKSFVRDAWELGDTEGRIIGTVTEDSQLKAIVRRLNDFAAALMPQSFHVQTGSETVAQFHQRLNPFVQKLDVQLAGDIDEVIDRRLIVAAAILISAIEGRQG